MLTWLFNRSASRRRASELYGAVVASARRPTLYTRMGVADTPEGRYELIVLHLFLVMERLRAEGPGGLAAAQALVEAFVTDMDDNMREMGVGDLTVPRKVKKAAAAFYDRTEVYRAALAQTGEGALAAQLVTLIPSTGPSPGETAGPATGAGTPDLPGLAAHVRAFAAALAALPLDDVLAGRFAAN